MATTKRLKIPYVSQLGPGAEFGTGDCGLTCVTQLARAFGQNVTVDQVSQSVGLPRGFTSAHILNHVAKAAEKLGIRLMHRSRLTIGDIERELLDNRTVLLLVFYPFLQTKFDPTYADGHFVTVTGMEANDFFYDDPFWPFPKGEDIRINKNTLMAAANKTGPHARTPGQALLLRSHKLPDVEPEVVVTEHPAPVSPDRFTLRGTIKNEQGQPLQGASVRLAGPKALLVDAPGVVLAPVPGAVAWSRTITGFDRPLNRWDVWTEFVKGQTSVPFAQFSEEVVTRNPHLARDEFVFQPDKEYLIPEPASTVAWSRPLTNVSGSRWSAYVQHVEEQVEGISAREFIDDSLRHNPSLDPAQPIFDPAEIYRFPENLWGGTLVEWSRVARDLSGSRWNVWTSQVKGQVEGIGWDEFKDDALVHNPSLDPDLPVFQPGESYRLPRNVVAERYYLIGWTGSDGRYRFQGLRPGRYELVVDRPGHETARARVAVRADGTHDVVMSPVTAREPTDETRVEPTRPDTTGFIQRRGASFTRDGRAFRFVGVNLRGLAHYGFHEIQTLRESHPAHRTVQLGAAKQMGAKVVRLFLANRHINRQATGDRLAEALRLAEANDMYLLVAFTDVHSDTGFNPSGDEARFYTEGGKLNRDWYERGYRDNYLPLVEEIVTRFKGHPRIFAWELGNELKALGGGQVLPEVFIHFAHTVSDRIRQLDPAHLIATGVINSFSLGCNDSQARRLNAHPNIDFLTAHIYQVDDPGQFEGHLNLADIQAELQRAEREANLARSLDKPFIIEEIGFCGGDRVQQTRRHLSKWYDQFSAAACLPWALMATDQNMGDGDANFGIDRTLKGHGNDFSALLNAYRERANALG